MLLSIIKNGNASTLEVVNGVRAALQTARAAAPPGLRISELFDQSVFVKASVAEVKRAGHFGHAGTLSLKVESTTAVDGQKIPLRASKSSAGDSHMGATVALTVLFGPLGLLKHGNDVKYPAGTKVTVYTDQQMTVKVAQ